MTNSWKSLERFVRGEGDAAMPFEDLCRLLVGLGFVETVRGSPHVFRRAGVAERINLQREGRHAKVYQVRQVRRILIANRLTGGA